MFFDRLWNIDMFERVVFFPPVCGSFFSMHFFCFVFGWDRIQALLHISATFCGLCDVLSGWSPCGCLAQCYFEFHCYGQTAHTHTHTLAYSRSYTSAAHYTKREFKWMWKSCCVRLTLILNHIIEVFFVLLFITFRVFSAQARPTLHRLCCTPWIIRSYALMQPLSAFAMVTFFGS